MEINAFTLSEESLNNQKDMRIKNVLFRFSTKMDWLSSMLRQTASLFNWRTQAFIEERGIK